jgi:hypothetical protein
MEHVYEHIRFCRSLGDRAAFPLTTDMGPPWCMLAKLGSYMHTGDCGMPVAWRNSCLKQPTSKTRRGAQMEMVLQTPVVIAAAGYSLVYLLAGGGFFGAFMIFLIAKMLGK